MCSLNMREFRLPAGKPFVNRIRRTSLLPLPVVANGRLHVGRGSWPAALSHIRGDAHQLKDAHPEFEVVRGDDGSANIAVEGRIMGGTLGGFGRMRPQ